MAWRGMSRPRGPAARRNGTRPGRWRRARCPSRLLGVDKGDDVVGFVAAMREAKVTPHVAQKAKGSAIDGCTTRHAGYPGPVCRFAERIEEIFGWAKTVGSLRKARCVGLAQMVFTLAAYDLTRMATLCGWALVDGVGRHRPQTAERWGYPCLGLENRPKTGFQSRPGDRS